MSLPTSPIAGALPEIQARFTESSSEIHFMPEDESPIPGTIRIKRHVKAKWDAIGKRFLPLEQSYWEWDKTVLLLINAEDIVDKVVHGHDMLSSWIQDARLLLDLDPTEQIVIIVKGLGKYTAKTRTLANREFTAMARAGLESGSAATAAAVIARPEKEAIERELIELQVQESVFIVHGEDRLDQSDDSGEDGRHGRLGLESLRRCGSPTCTSR
jgi:crossover junction endonuclease EME1